MFTHLLRVVLSCLLVNNASAALAQVLEEPLKGKAILEHLCDGSYECPEHAATQQQEQPQLKQPKQSLAPIRIASPASWDRDCVPHPVPRVTVIVKPAHGDIEFGERTVRPIRVLKGNPKCAGTDQHARIINYIPTEHPAESDLVSLSILTWPGHRYEIDCTVRISERRSECKMR